MAADVLSDLLCSSRKYAIGSLVPVGEQNWWRNPRFSQSRRAPNSSLSTGACERPFSNRPLVPDVNPVRRCLFVLSFRAKFCELSGNEFRKCLFQLLG